MEILSQTETQHNPENAQVITMQNTAGPASEHSTVQTDYSGEGNWQEELCQTIKTMKNQYLSALSDLYSKISKKLLHIDNNMPAQKLTEQYKKMKNFKLMLERILQFLQTEKSSVKLALKDRIPTYERVIVCILDSQKRSALQRMEQSVGQAPSCNTSRIPVDSAASYPGEGDFHESLYQINKTLKNHYMAGLSDLYEISAKLHADIPTASLKPIDHSEEMKSFKLMSERSLHSLRIGKGSVQPALEEGIPIYKRQIISILNSEEWKPEETLQQSAGQASSASSLERSNVKRFKLCLNDDIHS